MNDPLGQAVWDYLNNGKAADVVVKSDGFEDDIIPTAHFFRTYQEMPQNEQLALQLARGKVLDVGAGAGCHSLELQQRGCEVSAVDSSPLACKCMQARGVQQVFSMPFSEVPVQQYDTILFLMNGIGIQGGLEQLPALLTRLKMFLHAGSQILFDSSDLRYLYEQEDGSVEMDLNARYYGEFRFQMCYKEIEGEWFDWTYVDPESMRNIAHEEGFEFEVLHQDDHYAYLGVLKLA